MGIQIPASLQHLFERLAEPVHGLFHGAEPAAPEDYELLWDCYASGQMSDADLEREVAADPRFAHFLKMREPVFH